MDESQKKLFRAAKIDIDAVLARFSSNDALFFKYLFRFPEEPTFNQLVKSFTDNDEEKIKESAHTLKGISGNLGLTALYDASSQMHQNIRGGKKETLPHDFEKVQAAYNHYIEAIETARKDRQL